MTADLRAIAYAPALVPSPLGRYRPPVHREVREGVVLVRALPPETGPNFAVALGPAPSPERVLALAADFFAGTSGGYELSVDAGYWRDAHEMLLARGFRLEEEEPGLVLAPIPATIPTPPPELEVRPVTDEAALEDFFTVAETPRRIVPSLACATDPAVGLLVGYVDGRPTATARMALVGGTTDITGVVTAPAYRRRGYGTAMTWAAVREGAARGAASATLTATEMGYPVYVRMGFVPVCTFRAYASPGT